MRIRRWLLTAVAATTAAIALGVALHGAAGIRAPGPQVAADPAATSGRDGTYRRIVSLSPSITECLFALGLGRYVVGVTDFCDYPPEALTKSKVGGYYDLNYEAIVALRPDLVVCLPDHAEHLDDLDRLDLPHLTVDHRRVETILESLRTLGRICDATERAQVLVQDIQQRIATVRKRAAGKDRPHVLVCVERDMRARTIDNVYVAGRGGFYDEMIALAGGVNAYPKPGAFPVVSAEGLQRLRPEIIIDIVADLSERGLTEPGVLQQWDSLAEVPAVREQRVFVFTEGFVVIPGPRFVQILERMAAVIHPTGTPR